MDKFVHLEVQSSYSFLWGCFTPEALVEATKKAGYEAIALTDSWSLHGAVRFYLAAKKEGIQPIIGAKVQLWDSSWITLLAKDFKGYGNLCRIITAGLGRDRKRVLRHELKNWSEGLICLSGGWGSRIRELARAGHLDGTGISLLPLREIFKKDLYVVLAFHVDSDLKANQVLFEVTSGLGIPVVATNQVTFLSRKDYIVHRLLVDIQRRHHHRETRPLPNDSFYLCSQAELQKRIPFPEAIRNAWEIKNACKGFRMPVGRLHPPVFKPKDVADTSLARAALRELARRHDPVPFPYLQRLERELEVIRGKNLSGFFLLVKEVVEFARRKGIRCSIRGSAAGSLVVHLLHFGPDPIKHGLLFERFINEGRGDMPDIDLDFDSERRYEVTRWLMERYPQQTALVATISSFRVRSAVRLAARALGYPLNEITRLTTCLPWSLRGIPLKEAFSRLPELKDSPLRQEKALLAIAERIEGLPFQASVHLGGVILTPDDVTSWTPVSISNKGFRVGQLDKDDIDALGLLKLDLLGLRMHTALRKSEEILKEQGVELNLERIPHDDPDTYALLRTTETLGVFQLESPGQRNLVGRLNPGRFSDLVAEISLFRPGPVKSDMVTRYVERKHGREPVQYIHPCLKPILEETYGVIVFQEQVLRIVHEFAGFSYSDADAFRRAMTKDRSQEEMSRLKAAFMEGAKRMGRDPALSEEVFKKISAFAAYGFCKAHAVAFAEITLQSAYLKAHHPMAFYLGLLNAGHVGSYPPSVILNEARRWGIPIYPPHANFSHVEYRPEGEGIRVPLTVIYSIGHATALKIVKEREKRGPFEDMASFRSRVKLPGRIFNVLLYTGALEGLKDEELSSAA